MSTRDDVYYRVNVQDRDLKRLASTLRSTNRLLTQTDTRGARAGGAAASGFNRTARSAAHAEREVNRVTRGMVAASGVAGRLGRIAAFGSLGFIGGATVAAQLRKVFEQTNAAKREQQALDAQLDASGISATKYGARVEAVATAQAHLAAVNVEDVQRALTGNIRTTGELTQAYRLNAIALDVAAAKHRDVVNVAQVLDKVWGGNVGAARRLGIVIDKNVKNPLVALNIIQRMFAGQAEAAANTAGGAYTRIQNAIRSDRIAFGEGILPVVTRDLEALEKKLADPATIAAIHRIGEEVSTELEQKLESAAHFVQEHWPEIKRDFNDAGEALKISAGAASTLASALDKIGQIVPAHDSILRLLLEGVLINKLTRGKLFAMAGGAASASKAESVFSNEAGAAVGVGSVYAGEAHTAKMERALKTAERLRASLGKIARIGTIVVAVDLLIDKRTQHEVGSFLQRHVPGLKAVSDYADRHVAFLRHLDQSIGVFPKDDSLKRAQREMEKAWGTGISAGVDKGQAHFNERITQMASVARDRATAAAKAATSAFDTAFGAVEDKILQAFDGRTNAILDSFDAKTQTLEARLKTLVVVPKLHERFTVSVDGKTPAERELEALGKIEEKRHYQRDIFDARRNLAAQRQIGDPVAIRDAERQLQDAETERKRFVLEGRAATERKAADAAIAANKTAFEARRAEARKNLAAERQLQREHLQAELDAEKKAIESGKLNAGKGQRAIVATMRKYGVNYKQAGADLGTAFGVGLQAALTAANRAIDRLEAKLVAANRSAGKLKKVSEAAFAGMAGRKIAAAVSAALGIPTPTPDVKPRKVSPEEIARLKRERDRAEARQRERTRRRRRTTSPTRGRLHVQAYDTPTEPSLGPYQPATATDADTREPSRLEPARIPQGLLRTLTRAIAQSDLHGGLLHPVHIERLVERSGRRLTRAQKLALEQKLAQEQAHPFLEGLVRATPTGTRLGPGGRSGRARVGHPVSSAHPGAVVLSGDVSITITDSRNPHRTARVVREELLKHGQRGYVRKRGAERGKNLGLG